MPFHAAIDNTRRLPRSPHVTNTPIATLLAFAGAMRYMR